MKKETQITNDQLSFAGCYAITEEEFEREIENFVCDDWEDFALEFENEVDGRVLNAREHHFGGEHGCMTVTNFYVLSKREPDDSGEYYTEFWEEGQPKEDIERVKELGFKSLFNINNFDFRNVLLGLGAKQ